MPWIKQLATGGAALTARPVFQPSGRPAIAVHESLYQVAYQEGQRALDDQMDELKDMRTRAVQFTAFVGAATAFLAGSGLKAPHRDAAFYVLAGTATALSALLILLLLALLQPQTRRLWYYRMSPKSLISGWIETKDPPDEASFMKALAELYDFWQSQNDQLLGVLRSWYRWLVVVGAAQVSMWAALVWVKA